MKFNVPQYNFIVIEGNIGAGKTSLATRYLNQQNAHLILEQFAKNPFLERFYQNPERYSFPVELSFLMFRYKQLQEELHSSKKWETVVADYYFIKSLLFAETTLPTDEFLLYRQIFESLYTQLPKPSLFIYLHQNIATLLKNIRKRGRAYEQNIKANYLEQIEKSYIRYFDTNPGFPIVIVDVGKIDFVENESDYMQLKEALFNQTFTKGVNHLKL